jgi:hypothetical protein
VTDSILERFTGIGETFPGSKKRRRPGPGMEAPTAELARTSPVNRHAKWDDRPVVYAIKGVNTELFHVGDLAKALYRTAHTMRKWEERGYLPETFIRTPGVNRNGQHRLYTREQVEGLVKIATDEGILDHNRQVGGTEFPRKARALFAELKALT